MILNTGFIKVMRLESTAQTVMYPLEEVKMSSLCKNVLTLRCQISHSPHYDS